MSTVNNLLEAFKASEASSIQHEGPQKLLQNDKRLSEGKSFAQVVGERKEIADQLKGFPEGTMKDNMSVLMNNWLRATTRMNESTRSSSIANFNKYAFPLIRTILPEMASPRLFSMQTMFGPTSQIFYFNYVYGTTRGGVLAGQKLFENTDPNYGANQIPDEVLASGNGTQKTFTGAMAYAPIIKGTISISDGTQYITDDGNGNLVGSVSGAPGTNSIDYTTGVYTFTMISAPDLSNPITAMYTVNSEGNEAGIPEIDLMLTSSQVTAISTKLRMRWSLEAEYSLRDTMGLEAEGEAVTAMGAEIAYEIDQKNVEDVMRVALDKRSDPAFTFDITPTTGISFRDWKENIVDYFIKASSEILDQSGRAIGNKVVAGTNVTNVIESLVPRFQPATYRASRGIHFIGVLDGRWEIFKSLRMDKNEWLMLFKGEEFLFAGFVFAPWILAFTTPTTVLDDMQSRKGMGSLYGKKIVNAKYFLKAKVVKTGV